MHPLPRRTLRRLIEQYGPTLLDNPARVDALLADHCGKYRAERFVLVYALRERASGADRSDTYWHVLCSRRLQSRYCFSSEAAHWAAECWSSALRIDPPEPNTSRKKGDSLNGLHGELSDHLSHALSKLLTDYGFDLLKDPDRVNALLADVSGEFGRERILLVHALREGIPADLLSQKGESTASMRHLTQRLQKRYSFSDKASQWAVECWSAALHHAEPATASKPQGEKRAERGNILGRLSLRQIVWLGLCLIGVLVLVVTWQSAFEYAEWGVAWLLSIPGLVGEKLAQFVDLVAKPAIAWLLGFPGLIALGAISGLLAIKSLGSKRVWGGIAWLFRILWIALKWVSGRLTLRQKMWLVAGLIGIMVLGYTWQSAIVYAEWGIIWLQGVPERIEEKLSQLVDHVAIPVTTWLVGRPGLIALGAIVGLLTVKSLGLRKVWRGISWLIRMTWLGLGQVWRGFAWLIRMIWLGLRKVLGRLSLRLKMWLGLGLIGIMVLTLTWQTTIVYTELGITWALGIPEWTEEKLSQFVDHVAQPVITWIVGIPGLIALGAIAGMLAVKSLGLERVWRGVTWLTRVAWLGLGITLGQLVLRRNMWLGLGFIGILVLALAWQNSVVYTEWGITWLLGIPEWAEERFSQFVNHVAQPVITWLAGNRDQ